MQDIEVNINKLDAVEMQLDAAIFLFFENRNIIACETLVSASLGILRALVEKDGIYSPIWENDIIKDEYKKDWKKALNARSNFLKHADNDYDNMIKKDIDIVRIKLMEADYLYVELCKNKGRKLCANVVLFHIWFSLKYPEMMQKKSCLWQEWMTGLKDRKVDPNNFQYFLELAIRNRIN